MPSIEPGIGFINGVSLNKVYPLDRVPQVTAWGTIALPPPNLQGLAPATHSYTASTTANTPASPAIAAFYKSGNIPESARLNPPA
ncbi:MAG: hypothetical protein Fur0046_18940 [Cyanobacteria bacterium J069]